MRSIRAYILALAALFCVLLGMATAVIVQRTEALGSEQTRAQLLDTTRALALVVDGRLEGYKQLAGALAASQAVQRRDFPEIRRQAAKALNDPDAWIMMADRSGQQVVNTHRPLGAPLPKGPLADEIWRELDRGTPRVCNLATGLVERQILCVDYPIMKDGRAEYVLSVIFRPRLLQRIVEAQRVPKGRYATVLDRDGTVVWRNLAPETYVGKKATADMLAQLRSKSEGVIRSRALDGTMTEAAFSRSSESGWTVITAIPRHEFAAASRRALRDGGWMAALLLGAALATAWLAVRALTEDIARLGAAARRIRAGEAPKFEAGRFEEFDAVGSLLAEAIAERDASRERFDLAQEVGGVGSWDWDTPKDEGRVSDTYKVMHGLTDIEGPLKFAQVLAVIHPDDRDLYLAQLNEARTRRESSSNEYRVVWPDGSVRWVAAKGRPIFDDEGKLVGSVGIVRDATAEHEAEDALHQLNELLERQVEERTAERDRLWNIARDPFVVADSNGVWLAASPAWTSLLGYPLEDFLGRTSEWLEHPDDIARTRAEDQRLAQGEVTEKFENRFRAKDGSYKWLSWTSVPEGGRFYSVAREITTEKAQAEALKKAEAALRQSQKMESIGQITGGVAHDFNNLLTPIIGTLDLLQQRGLPDPRSERMVSAALEAGERARMLVQRLLAFARRQPLQTEPVSLVRCIGQIQPLLDTTVGPKVRLSINLDEGLPSVVADCNQLELAVLNLAVNARDAMPDGGELTIDAAVMDVGEQDGRGLAPGRYVELRVSDTGVGMPASVAERAVEPFFSTKGLGRGTGLGLSMVHGLMAQLGGGMNIVSALGKGTTIQLWLKTTDEGARAAPATIEAAPQPTASGVALLVDDEELVRASVAQMLSGLGYEVVEASSGKEALAILDARSVDLLVSDHLMPGLSGVELAREARRRSPDLPILIISGYADVDDIAPDFPRLTKPFRQAELSKALPKRD